MKTADVPWEVRRHLLCKQMGWTPNEVDEMPWVDVLWTERLVALEAKADKAMAEAERIEPAKQPPGR